MPLTNVSLIVLKISKGENSSILLHISIYLSICMCVLRYITVFIIKDCFAAANLNLPCFKSN